jgi:hypothetical protein
LLRSVFGTQEAKVLEVIECFGNQYFEEGKGSGRLDVSRRLGNVYCGKPGKIARRP